MFNFIKNHKKLNICIAIVIGILILSRPIVAQEKTSAIGINFDVKNPVTIFQVILGALLLLINLLLNVILTLIGNLLSFIINITDFKDVILVHEGWKIVRDFVNLIFILVLLLIGFATILDLQQYGVKRLLPALLIAALLINFSLPLAGFVLDIAQGFTKFFINKMHLTDGDFSKTLSNSLGIGSLGWANEEMLTNSPTIPQILTQSFKNALPLALGPVGFILWRIFTESSNTIDKNNTALILLLFKTFIMLAYIFTLTVATIFFVVRIGYIWLLLIASPAAWAAYALPWTKKYFHQWWNQFLDWAFFAPIYLFILYLTLFTVQTGNIQEQLTQANTSSTIVQSLGVSIKFIIQFVLVILMLLGGIKFALTFASKSSKTTMAFAEKIAGGITGLTFAQGLYKGFQAKRKEAKAPSAGEIWGRRLGLKMEVPLTEKVKARFLPKEEREKWLKESERKRIDEYKKRNATLATKDLDEKLTKGVSQAEAKAIMELGLERKRISPQMEKYLSLLDKKQREELLMQRPDLYNKFTAEEIKDAIGVDITGNKIADLKNIAIKIHDKGRSSDIAKESLKDLDIQKAFASDPELKKILPNIIKQKGIEAMKEINTTIAKSINDGILQFTTEDQTIRNIYAINSGDIKTAFYDKTTNTINKTALTDFIKSVSAQDIAKLNPDLVNNPEIFGNFVQNATPKHLASILNNNPQTGIAMANVINNMTQQEFENLGANAALIKYINKNGSNIGLSFRKPTPSNIISPEKIQEQKEALEKEIKIQQQYEEKLEKEAKRVEETQKEIEEYQKDLEEIDKQKQQEKNKKYYTPE